MRYLTLLFAAVLLLTGTLASASGSSPVISPYGKFYPVDGADFMPQKTKEPHKILVVTSVAPPSPSEVDPSLDAVARIINLYNFAGVPVSDLKIVVVIRGSATPIALSSSAYQQKFSTPNPNTDLIRQLKNAGVTITVCGQAWGAEKFTKEDMDKNVSESLSGLTTSIILQEQGYVLVMPDE